MWTPEHQAKATAMRQKGLSYNKIGAALGFNKETVHKHLDDNYRVWSNARVQAARQKKPWVYCDPPRRPSVCDTETSVVRMVVNPLALGDTSTQHVPVSVPRLRFLEAGV